MDNLRLEKYKRIEKKEIDGNIIRNLFKVRLLPSPKNCVNCFIESPLNMMRNAFYFILKKLISIFQANQDI